MTSNPSTHQKGYTYLCRFTGLWTTVPFSFDLAASLALEPLLFDGIGVLLLAESELISIRSGSTVAIGTMSGGSMTTVSASAMMLRELPTELSNEPIVVSGVKSEFSTNLSDSSVP